MKDENLFLYLKIGSKLYFIIHILTTLEYISNKVNNTHARVRMEEGRKLRCVMVGGWFAVHFLIVIK